jgi:flagellar biosynthesis GTPase FlhF
MNLNQTTNNGDKLIACEKKIEKMTLRVFILRNKQINLSNKIDKKEEKLNKQKVKYAEIKERQSIQSSKIEATSAKQQQKSAEMAAKQEAKAAEMVAKEQSKAAKEQAKATKEQAKATKEQAKATKEQAKATKTAERIAKEEARASKSAERAAAKEIKTYISTATHLQTVSKLSNEYIIHISNSNDISIDNLLRINGYRIQEEQPTGWDISTFKSRFIQDFGSTNWLKGMQNQSKSISSAFYRMCPESSTSRSKITRKLCGIPSFVKSNSTSKYIFDANLYLDF